MCCSEVGSVLRCGFFLFADALPSETNMPDSETIIKSTTGTLSEEVKLHCVYLLNCF